MFSRGPTYKRPLVRVARIRTEADDDADALFGPFQQHGLLAVPPVKNPSEDNPPGVPLFRNPSSARPRPRGLRNSPQPQASALDYNDPPAATDDEDERATTATTVSTHRTGTDSLGFHSPRKKKKRRRREKRLGPDYDILSATVRKAKNPQAKNTAHRPMADFMHVPEYLKFQEELKDLENHEVIVQPEEDYWKETTANSKRDDELAYKTTLQKVDARFSPSKRFRKDVSRNRTSSWVTTTGPPSTEESIAQTPVPKTAPTAVPRRLGAPSLSPGQHTPSKTLRLSQQSSIRDSHKRWSKKANMPPLGVSPIVPVSPLVTDPHEFAPRSNRSSRAPVYSRLSRMYKEAVETPDVGPAASTPVLSTSMKPSRPAGRRTSSPHVVENFTEKMSRDEENADNDDAKGDTLVEQPAETSGQLLGEADAPHHLSGKSEIQRARSSRRERSRRVASKPKVVSDSGNSFEGIVRLESLDKKVIDTNEQRAEEEQQPISSPLVREPASADDVTHTSARTGVLARWDNPIRLGGWTRRAEASDRPITSTNHTQGMNRISSDFPSSSHSRETVSSPKPASKHSDINSQRSLILRTQNIPASLRRLRDSLPIFSPAIVLGEDDRHTLPSSDGSKLSRRSVVSNTQKSPLDLILDVATPPRIVPSEHLLIDHYEHITKIGEGSYADVYSGFRNGEEVVLKIVPVDGFYIDKTPQTSLEDILSEVLIARELTRVLLEGKTEWVAPVFSETYFVTVAKGLYPDVGRAHYAFLQDHSDLAINFGPDTYNDENQRFVMIGLKNGGEPLDSFPLMNFDQAKSVFMQVAFGLAVAEQALEFEHRDLHISNILVRLTGAESILFVCDETSYEVPTSGVHATIIDWTLSRMSLGEKTVYKDLSCEERIFEGKGDEQFDVYRNMKKGNKNDWEIFKPKSNILWLKYLQKKLLTEKHIMEEEEYRESQSDLQDFFPKSKVFRSATDLVNRTPLFQKFKLRA